MNRKTIWNLYFSSLFCFVGVVCGLVLSLVIQLFPVDPSKFNLIWLSSLKQIIFFLYGNVVHFQIQSKAIDLVYALCETLQCDEACTMIEEFV